MLRFVFRVEVLHFNDDDPIVKAPLDEVIPRDECEVIPDVLATVRALRERGVGFVESAGVHAEARGALTQSYLGGAMFELVHHER